MAEFESQNPVEFSRYVYEELKHVRIIHFSLLVVTAAIAYVVFTNWSPAVELHSDLESFQATAHGLTRSPLQKGPSILKRINPDKFGLILRHIQDTLSGTMRSHVDIYRNASYSLDDCFRLNRRNRTFLDSIDSKSLRRVRHEIEGGVWYIDRIGGFSGNIGEARKTLIGWFHKWPPNPTIYVYDVRIESAPSDIASTVLGRASLSFSVTSRGYFSDFPPMDLVGVEMSWTSAVDTVYASKDWFMTSHPWMRRYWDSLATMTIDQALEWASFQESNMLAGRQFNVLGLSFDGRHIGYVGPLVVAVLLLYLTSYLLQIHKRVRIYAAGGGLNISGIAPWIGAMDNAASQFISGVTLAGASVLGIALPAWRLAGLPCLWAWGIVSVGVVTTVCISRTSSNLSRMYSSIRSVRSYKQSKEVKRRRQEYQESSK